MTEMSMGSNIALPATSVRAALTWTAAPGVPGPDVSALLVDATGRVAGEADFVFYNQPSHPSGAVVLAGRTSGADPLDLDLTHVPAATERVVLAASVDGATFGQIPDLRIDVVGPDSQPIATFPIAAGHETALVCGEFYRRGGEWKFRAVGQGYTDGLAGLATDFGIDVIGTDASSSPHGAPTPAVAQQASPAPPTRAAPPASTPPSEPTHPASAPASAPQRSDGYDPLLDLG